MRLVVTRPAEDAGPWIEALRSQGHDVLGLPVLGIGPAADQEPVRQAWQRLGAFAAVMFVSGNAARQFAAACADPASVWRERAAHTRAWATGPGTAAALRSMGLSAAQVDAPDPASGQFDSEHLWHRVRGSVRPGERVLIVRGTQGPDSADAGVGRDWLAAQLQVHGVAVEFVVAYQRACARWAPQQTAQALDAVRCGALWLISSSEGVACLARLLPSDVLAQLRAHVTHARIAQAAAAAGCQVVSQSRPTLADVLASIELTA